MVLVVGGRCQGKYGWVMENLVPKLKNPEIMNQYHLAVRENLSLGKDPIREAARLITAYKEKELIIIMDEIGCGLVPVDSFERRYRDIAGQTGCYLAGEAKEVMRIVCGIGMKIKG